MIQKAAKILLKIFLIGIAVFILLLMAAGLFYRWPTFFYDRDEWSATMVERCNGNFENCVGSADEVANFDWDKIYVFMDSVRDKEISKILGFEYDNLEGLTKRKVIFVKDGAIVHEELNFYDPFDGPPNGSTFFAYDAGDPPYYIARNREDARFQIKKDGDYFRIIPLSLSTP